MNLNFIKNILAVIGAFTVLMFLGGAMSQIEAMFAGVDMVTGTIEDVNESVFTEKSIENHISTVQEQKREFYDTLSELEMDEEELKAIFQSDVASEDNALQVLRKTARNIKRAKAFASRVIGTKQFNPSSVTAVNTAESARSLDEVKVLLAQVVENQNRDYRDRVLERAMEKHATYSRRKMIHEKAREYSKLSKEGGIPFESFKRKENPSFTERISNFMGMEPKKKPLSPLKDKGP